MEERSAPHGGEEDGGCNEDKHLREQVKYVTSRRSEKIWSEEEVVALKACRGI